MDETTRGEIAAATVAHRDLGPGYDDAVAEGLVERIGAEIDRRVDARLAQSTPTAPPAPAFRPGVGSAVVAVGSMLCGLGGTAIAVFATATNVNGRFHNTIGHDQILIVAVIWAAIAVVNIAYARRR